MAAKKKNIISKASPHTIKKFELIEEYIKSWAQKLLLTESCNGLIFIDCMCNSGVYTTVAHTVYKDQPIARLSQQQLLCPRFDVLFYQLKFFYCVRASLANYVFLFCRHTIHLLFNDAFLGKNQLSDIPNIAVPCFTHLR